MSWFQLPAWAVAMWEPYIPSNWNAKAEALQDKIALLMRWRFVIGLFIFLAWGIYVTYSIDRYRSKPEEKDVFLSAMAGIILWSLISFSWLVLMWFMAYDLVLFYWFWINAWISTWLQ